MRYFWRFHVKLEKKIKVNWDYLITTKRPCLLSILSSVYGLYDLNESCRIFWWFLVDNSLFYCRFKEEERNNKWTFNLIGCCIFLQEMILFQNIPIFKPSTKFTSKFVMETLKNVPVCYLHSVTHIISNNMSIASGALVEWHYIRIWTYALWWWLMTILYFSSWGNMCNTKVPLVHFFLSKLILK